MPNLPMVVVDDIVMGLEYREPTIQTRCLGECSPVGDEKKVGRRQGEKNFCAERGEAFHAPDRM